MDNDIKVSICCITYNQEKYIRDAIESFLKQKTNFKYEILIRDVSIHLILTNTLIIYVFFCLQNYDKKIFIYCFTLFLIIYILLNLLYRNYLKYYINEIYIEFLNINK